ncbi:MAG: hypothetical protein FJX76_04895 [Armatimonadetes bacterium]|nr:hypothetical protein [Armatimonadota bacterium]
MHDFYCKSMAGVLGRALRDGWNPALEKELDDVEMDLGIGLERLEDMEPGVLREEGKALLMTGIEALQQLCEEIRGADSADVLMVRLRAADGQLQAGQAALR